MSSSDENLGIWKIHPDGSNATRLAEGSFVLPEVSPDGRFALFTQMLVQNARILVVAIESGEMEPFEIMIPATGSYRDVLLGRARWTANGHTILYIGQDEQRRSGVYAQDFVPGLDTSGSRRPVAGFSSEYFTESLGVSPDGKSLVISARIEKQSLKLAENVGLLGWE
jgi:Tol biopolymer transport system component